MASVNPICQECSLSRAFTITGLYLRQVRALPVHCYGTYSLQQRFVLEVDYVSNSSIPRRSLSDTRILSAPENNE